MRFGRKKDHEPIKGIINGYYASAGRFFACRKNPISVVAKPAPECLYPGVKLVPEGSNPGTGVQAAIQHKN